MTPLTKGSKFAAKIRFKNLSAVELGALMMTFDLYGLKDAAYKIGQGKSFGFGSVKITPTLYIESETAYTQIFDAQGWQNPYCEKNPAEYFDGARHVLMAELKKILDWSLTERANWNSKIKAINGVDERFKQRAPLPSIFEVVK